MINDKAKEILLEKAYVTADDLKRAEEFAKNHDSNIEEFLMMEGFIAKDALAQIIARAHDIEFADFGTHQPDPALIQKIPEEKAK